MSTTTFTITRELPDESRDIEVDISYDRSAYGIDYTASIDGEVVQLTDNEQDALFDKIWQEEGEWND